MPSMVGPTPDQIRSHKLNNTILGHSGPASEGSKSSPHSSPQPVVSPVSPRQTITAQPARTPVHPSPPRSNRQATLVGHPALDAARRTAPLHLGAPYSPSAVGERTDTSQTLPSMQAVTSETSSGPQGVVEETEEEPPGAPEPDAEAPSYQRPTASDNPAKTYFAVAAAAAEPQSAAELDAAPVFPGLGTPPPLPTATPTQPEGLSERGPKELNPSHRSAPPAASVGAPLASTSIVPQPSAGHHPSRQGIDGANASVLSRRSIQSRLGKVVLSVTALLGLGLLVFTWVWRPAPPVSGRIDPHVTPAHLQLQCDSCADGSHVTLNGHRAEFRGQRASLPLVQPPAVGVNSFALDIHRTGIGRDERVTLAVNVEYRASWDLSALTADPPLLALTLEAAPGIGLQVNGASVNLDQGRGHATVALSRRFTAPSAAIEWLETSVPVQAIGSALGGEQPFAVRVPVVPLTVDAPTPQFQTEASTVVVSGRSWPHATITGAGQRVETDAQGYFQLPVSARLGVNVVEISASLQNHVPRSVSAPFTRTDNLTKAAVAYQSGAIRRFDELIHQLALVNTPLRVALAGRVQEWRTEHNVTIALLAITSGCPNRTCLVRAEHPAALALEPNRSVSVFGEATLSSNPGAPIPVVQSHFILE